MRQKNWWVPSLAFSVLMFASLACSLVTPLLPSTGVTALPPTVHVNPTSAPPKPTTTQSVPTPTLVDTQTPASPTDGQTDVAPTALPVVRSGYDGIWDGTNSDEQQVTFTVVNNQVTYVMLNFSVNSNGCSYSGALNNIPASAPIKNEGSSCPFKDSDGRQFTLSGKFLSDTQASGTIDIKGTADSFCGAFATKMPWTAKFAPPAADSTPVPAETPELTTPTETPEPVAGDPAFIVNGFFDAIKSGNTNAALAFADDSIIFSLGSASSEIGKDALKAALLNLKSSGISYTLSNVSSVGDSLVTFDSKSSDGKTYTSGTAMLSNGKIVILSIK